MILTKATTTTARSMPSVLPTLPGALPELTSPNQSFFGALGCACSIVFTVMGASYGTAKSAGAIFSSGVIRPDRMMQNTYDPVPPLSFPPLLPPPPFFLAASLSPTAKPERSTYLSLPYQSQTRTSRQTTLPIRPATHT